MVMVAVKSDGIQRTQCNETVNDFVARIPFAMIMQLYCRHMFTYVTTMLSYNIHTHNVSYSGVYPF